MYKLSIDNAEQVGELLGATVKDFHGKATKAGLRAVGNIVAKDLRGRVGSRSGALKRSITSKLMTRKVKRWYDVDNSDHALEVGALRKVADGSGRKRMQLYKYRWQETGTAQHMIKAWTNEGRLKRQQVRKFNKAGVVLKRSVVHPGQKANRQLAAVVSRNEGKAEAAFIQGVGKLLKKYGVE